MSEHEDNDQLNADIGDAFAEVFGQIVEQVETVARRFALPSFCVKALHMLSSPMSMKELGQKFHCDPSFVTAIADLLDSHGLGRRETDSRDRRIKNLLLTPKGLELRERVEQEFSAWMPWAHALDASERECLLGLLRKMIKAEHELRGQPAPATVQDKRAATIVARAGREAAAGPPDTTIAPPTTPGGNRAGEVPLQPSTAAPSGS
jgi:DNA-binding MarR family transcriptional regulator